MIAMRDIDMKRFGSIDLDHWTFLVVRRRRRHPGWRAVYACTGRDRATRWYHRIDRCDDREHALVYVCGDVVHDVTPVEPEGVAVNRAAFAQPPSNPTLRIMQDFYDARRARLRDISVEHLLKEYRSAMHGAASEAGPRKFREMRRAYARDLVAYAKANFARVRPEGNDPQAAPPVRLPRGAR